MAELNTYIVRCLETNQTFQQKGRTPLHALIARYLNSLGEYASVENKDIAKKLYFKKNYYRLCNFVVYL